MRVQRRCPTAIWLHCARRYLPLTAMCVLPAGHEHLAEVPILVLANKKDLRDAMTASELTTALALTDVKVRRRQWHTRTCFGIALSLAA